MVEYKYPTSELSYPVRVNSIDDILQRAPIEVPPDALKFRTFWIDKKVGPGRPPMTTTRFALTRFRSLRSLKK
jgi:hypothetical protein